MKLKKRVYWTDENMFNKSEKKNFLFYIIFIYKKKIKIKIYFKILRQYAIVRLGKELYG